MPAQVILRQYSLSSEVLVEALPDEGFVLSAELSGEDEVIGLFLVVAANITLIRRIEIVVFLNTVACCPVAFHRLLLLLFDNVAGGECIPFSIALGQDALLPVFKRAAAVAGFVITYSTARTRSGLAWLNVAVECEESLRRLLALL